MQAALNQVQRGYPDPPDVDDLANDSRLKIAKALQEQAAISALSSTLVSEDSNAILRCLENPGSQADNMASIGIVGACIESVKRDVDHMQEECDKLIASSSPDLDQLDDLTAAQAYLYSATEFLRALGTDTTEVTAELAKQSDDDTTASLSEIWTDLCNAIESSKTRPALGRATRSGKDLVSGMQGWRL